MTPKKATKVDSERRDAKSTTNVDHPEPSIKEMFETALNSGKRDMAVLKRLNSEFDELIKYCPARDLVKVFDSQRTMACAAGKSLAVQLIPVVGIDQYWRHMKDVLLSGSTNADVCECYGDVVLQAWRNARKNNQVKLQEEIETVLMHFVFLAIHSEKHHTMFMNTLKPLGKYNNSEIDSLIYRIVEPNLWRCLKAINTLVRKNACAIFFGFYPYITDDDFENAENLSRQQNAMMELLHDSDAQIRANACMEVLIILKEYWSTLQVDFKKNCFVWIVEDLSCDKVPEVRKTVYNGIGLLLEEANALNACNRALKSLFSKKGISDRSEKVRLAAFKLLNKIKLHRFIVVWDVVDMIDVLRSLQLETSKSVQVEISILLMKTFFPVFEREVILERAVQMGEMNYTATALFYRSAVGKQVISPLQALKCADYFTTYVYKCLRLIRDRKSDAEVGAPSSRSNCEETPTNEEMWQSSNLILDYLVVICSSLKARDYDEECFTEQERLRALITKLFRLVFANFSETPVLTKVARLGRDMRAGEALAKLALNEIENGERLNPVNERVFAELAANWDLLTILKLIDAAIEAIKNSLFPPPGKSRKKRRVNESSFVKGVSYLRILLTSRRIKHELEREFTVYVEKFYKDLAFLNQLAMKMIFNGEFATIALRTVCDAIQSRYALGVMLTVGKHKDENDASVIVLDGVQSDVQMLTDLLTKETDNLTQMQQMKLNEFVKFYISLWTHTLGLFMKFTLLLSPVCRFVQFVCESGNLEQLFLPTMALLQSVALVNVGKGQDLQDASGRIPSVDLAKLCLKTLLNSCESKWLDEKKRTIAWRAIRTASNDIAMLCENARSIIDFVLEIQKSFNEEEGCILTPEERSLRSDSRIDFCRDVLREHVLFSVAIKILQELVETGSYTAEATNSERLFRYGALLQIILLFRETVPSIKDLSARQKQSLFDSCTGLLTNTVKRLKELSAEDGVCEQIVAYCELH